MLSRIRTRAAQQADELRAVALNGKEQSGIQIVVEKHLHGLAKFLLDPGGIPSFEVSLQATHAQVILNGPHESIDIEVLTFSKMIKGGIIIDQCTASVQVPWLDSGQEKWEDAGNIFWLNYRHSC